MGRVIVLLLGMMVFKMLLPRRERRTSTSITPYGSVFDVAVPADLACSELCYPPSQVRQSHEHASCGR